MRNGPALLRMIGVICGFAALGFPTFGTPSAAPRPGDLDGNGVVNNDDLSLLTALLGGSLVLRQVPAPVNADVNGDGRVDSLDATLLQNFLGASAPALPTVTTSAATDLTPFSAIAGGTVVQDGGLSVFARGVCWGGTYGLSLLDRHTRDGAGPGAFVSTLDLETDSHAYRLRAYATNLLGTAYGDELSFTPTAADLAATILEPTGPDVAGVIPIRAAVDPFEAKVKKLEIYVDDTKLAEFTRDPYRKVWDTTALPEGIHRLRVVAYNKADQAFETWRDLNVHQTPLQPVVNRSALHFGAIGSGAARAEGGAASAVPLTPGQTVTLGNAGGGAYSWSVLPSLPWLQVQPSSGTGNGTFVVTVDPTGLASGHVADTLNVSFTGVESIVRPLPIDLNIYPADHVVPPFGQLEAPNDGITVQGAVLFSGWALDAVGVAKVTIYRQPLPGESLPAKLGDAVFVEGARPDIEAAYPEYPLNYRAGWGFELETFKLPGGGNQAYTLYAEATGATGSITTLGSRTIYCDNAHAVKPFGALESPTPGSTVSGTMYVNSGWVLTPQPNSIPRDGSTLTVYIDGAPVREHPYYNLYRQDIASLFPGYANSERAGGILEHNTTQYANGLHTISWTAVDNAGNLDGIGSRYFNIQNNNKSDSAALFGGYAGLAFDEALRVQRHPAAWAVTVVQEGRFTAASDMFPNQDGELALSTRPGERLEVRLWPDRELTGGEREPVSASFFCPFELRRVRGGLAVGGETRPLPVGSSLDPARGVFTWHPGPAFRGEYPLEFISEGVDGKLFLTRVTVRVGD